MHLMSTLFDIKKIKVSVRCQYQSENEIFLEGFMTLQKSFSVVDRFFHFNHKKCSVSPLNSLVHVSIGSLD